MTQIITNRMTAELAGDFVVFLIGMRINKPWKPHRWLPVARTMPQMLRELGAQPTLGLLGYHLQLGFPVILSVQYWRSFEHLTAYASNRAAAHLPAWAAFNKTIASNGDVGIWHETYQIAAGNYEVVYNNMPAFGLGTAGQLIPASGRKSAAAGRMGGSEPAAPTSVE
ncbi:MAG: DUF4188 domain-containing protein [Roseiflexaceae bacterium]|nr:DUF4188 domain-containing protein [Roseiflexaceae bacterium]